MSDESPRTLPASWAWARLKDLVVPIKRALTSDPTNILSISSTRGFVPQAEKWARFMAGKSLARYVELQRGEFAYNKGNSQTYPCGCIYRLRECDSAAVPFVYYCFRASSPLAEPEFLDHFFRAGALNGQLSRLINAGVRNNGLLNIREADFYDVQIPLPPLEEQRRVATMLQSVDDAIAAGEASVEQLDRVRRDLAEELLSGRSGGAEVSRPHGERVPGWPVVPLGEVAEIGNGSTPSRQRPDYWAGGTVPWLPTGKVNDRVITAADEFVTEKALAECPIRLLPPGTVLVAMIGQGKTRGMAAFLGIEACINQNFAYIRPGPRIRSWYLFHVLDHQYDRIRSSSQGSNQGALNCGILKKYVVPLPPIEEQDAIARAISAVMDRRDAENAVVTERRLFKAALVDALLTGRLRASAKDAA